MDNKVRGIISILIVTVFVAMIVIYLLSSEFSSFTDAKFDKFVSAFSGLIGVIVGYYFKGFSEAKKP